MSDEHNDLLRAPTWLTLALAALGSTSIELAVCGMTHSTAVALARSVGFVLAMLAGSLLLGRVRSRPSTPLNGKGRGVERREAMALIALALLPFVWHPARVALLGGGVMLETMLLEGLRNLGLGLAVLARRPRAAGLSTVVALFGVLIGASLVEGPTMTALTGAFAVLGVGWLLAAYWSSLPEWRESGVRFPVAGSVAVLGVIGVILAVSVVGPTSGARVLAGLMPTSGGHDWSDPEARSGVGDGPNEVDARESADSVGFSQSEVYLETDSPSLYDAFSDTFGEPIKKNKQERAIALSPTEIQRRKEHPQEDHRAGREFSTHRKPPVPRDPPGAEADALLYVRGRAPAHLRLVAYDTFDGESWIEGQFSWSDASLESEGEWSPWLRVETPEHPFLSGSVSHRVKVGRLQTGVVPASAHLQRFRVGSVNRVEFFEWTQPGIVRLIGRTIPPGTVIDTEIRSPRPDALRGLSFPDRPAYAYRRHWESDPGASFVRDLCSSWTEGVPRGWQQVEAVVSHLRSHCVLDRSATPPEDCDDLMAHFLVEARRGPDYLFASAAALMLRSLNYPTRVVGGLYVDPEKFDPIARHVAVSPEDAHLWVEVQVPGGAWVAIEPTPGFELMPPTLSMIDGLIASLAAARGWASRNAGALALLGLIVAVLVRYRREMLDAWETLAWWVLVSNAEPSRAVLGTLMLVERRASRSGRARPIGETTARWCGGITASAPEPHRDDLRALVLLVQWLSYAPRPPRIDDETRALCRRVVRTWTLRTFRDLARPARPPQEFA